MPPMTSGALSAPRAARVIVVEGDIGAGKTTLVEAMAQHLRARGVRAVAVPEPVEVWRKVGILGKFYDDPTRWAYAFQTFTYITRIQSVIAAYEADPTADVYILERSIYTDRYIFMQLQREQVDPAEWEMYNTWCDIYDRLMPFNLRDATFIYLKPNIDACMSRVAKRARVEEVKAGGETKGEPAPSGGAKPGKGVTREYQGRLRMAHEQLFQGMHGTPPYTRPFPPSAVVIMTGEAADSDFTPANPNRHQIVGPLLEIIFS